MSQVPTRVTIRVPGSLADLASGLHPDSASQYVEDHTKHDLVRTHSPHPDRKIPACVPTDAVAAAHGLGALSPWPRETQHQMAQIFHRSFNTISKASIFGGVFILAAIGWMYGRYVRSDYVTGVGVAYDHPVPFSHKHHVQGLGIDCRYCHPSAEKSKYAGIPPTQTCYNCHSQVWLNSPLLEPVRKSYETNKSIPWKKVHRLEDYVYFNHSIHVHNGIGCSTCHGPVHEMHLTYQHATLHMEWCLKCHKRPELSVRPPDKIYDMDWESRPRSEKYGDWTPQQLIEHYNIHRKISCSTCHR